MPTKNDTIQLPFTTSHAFIIGINDYQHLTPLSTAVNDATKIAEQLETQHNFKVHPPLLNATHDAIRKLLTEDIPNLVKEDDRILFYFAGHGIALDGEEGPNGYIVAADTRPGAEDTLIPMTQMHDALTTLPCRHGLLILDCCFSGAFKWSSGFRDVVFDMPKVIYEERFWRYCKDPAWQVITSAAHDQKAVDIITNQGLGLREEGDGDHSPFASSLLKALDGAGDVIPAGKGDGVMTATEIYSYLRNSVETQVHNDTKRQSPSIFNLKRHDKGEFIFLNPKHRFNLPPTPDRNPFMGLSSYNEENANLFYGRQRVITELLSLVDQHPLTVVSGASGTGKSSVIKAGIVPALRQKGHTILPVIRPGQTPLQTIATAIPNAKEQLGQGPAVLVIDQYEELITQCLHSEDHRAFELQLSSWLKIYPDLKIILSIRADFEPQFERKVLSKWWEQGRYVIPSFSLDEIREVITQPATQSVLFYEPENLVEKISEEVSQAPGALPLLSFTLSELYHSYLKSGREDRTLAEEDYQKLGGVIGALRTRADAEFEALPEAGQKSMQKLMLRLVSLEGDELASKRVYLEELHFSDVEESLRMRDISNQLVDARLLHRGNDSQGRSFIEPAHDALVRAWGRLWEWVKLIGKERINLQNKLGQAVKDYEILLATDAGKARNSLWNKNYRLDALKTALNRKDHWFNQQEEKFVKESILRRKNIKRQNWSIAAVVIVILSSLGFWAFQKSAEAENEGINKTLGEISQGVRYNFDKDHLKAFRLAELGYKISVQQGVETKEFEDLLIKSVHDHCSFLLADDLSFQENVLGDGRLPNNHRLVVRNQQLLELDADGNTVYVYPVAKNNDIFEGSEYDPFRLSISGNQKYIVIQNEYDALVKSLLFEYRGQLIDSTEINEDNDFYYVLSPFLFDESGKKYAKVRTHEEVSFCTEHEGHRSEFDLGDFQDAKTSAVALSPSGRWLARGSTQEQVEVFDMHKKDDAFASRASLLHTVFNFEGSNLIEELVFGNNEQVLKIKVEGEKDSYRVIRPFSFAFNQLTDEAKFQVVDPFTKETVTIEISSDGSYLENDFFTVVPNALESSTEPGLMLKQLGNYKPLQMGLFLRRGFSTDNRYFFAEDHIYPLGPDIILDWINKYKVLGPLAKVNLTEYTKELPEELAALAISIPISTNQSPPQPKANQSTESISPEIDYPKIIRAFIKAEDNRQFQQIQSFYAPAINRYWNHNRPSIAEVQKKYEDAWAASESSTNSVQHIETIADRTYLLHTNFTFKRKGQQPKTIQDSKVIFLFDESGKILEIYGAE